MEILKICSETVSDKVLRDKAFSIAKIPRYQSDLTPWFMDFFDKKTSGANTSGGAVKSEIMVNQQLAEKLYKKIFRKFKK